MRFGAGGRLGGRIELGLKIVSKVCLIEMKVQAMTCFLLDERKGFIAYLFENITVLIERDPNRPRSLHVRTMHAFVDRSSSYGAARLRADEAVGADAWSLRSR
jgi:hypothetical protein